MIELTDWLKAELVRRAEAAAPQECCGLISAPYGRTKGSRPGIGLWAAQNASQDPDHSFLIDPDDQRRILGEMWKRDEELVGIYHSHPRSGPEPSERDRLIAESHDQPLTWVIVGLPRCPRGCNGSTDAHCPECKDWGYVERFWVGELP